jgi:hypothetical protein
MSTKKWACLVTAAVALGSAPCAPVPQPASSEAPAHDHADDSTVERLPMPPPSQPKGLKERLEMAVEHVRSRDLLTTNGFWTVFHGLLGLGPSTTLLDPETHQRVNALDYICSGGELRGLRFLPTKWGLDVQIGPTFVGQGHQDQFIAEMAQWGMTPDRPFVVLGKEYTFQDFITHAKMRARVTEKQELSWAILIIGHFYGTDVEWTNGYGEKLRFEDVVRYELAAPMETAACGGTHRLFGLSWVHHLHLRNGGRPAGAWKDVADNTARHVELARKYRNPDGSFSTNFFRGPGTSGDLQLRMNTSGHILEWLALALSDAELRQGWVQEAANAVALMILEHQGEGIEGGTLYHAVHGLLEYYARVYNAEKLGPLKPYMILPPGESPSPTP